MAWKTFVLITVAGICLVMLNTGCAPQTNLSLNFTPNNVVTYKAASEVITDYRFEQPSIKKLVEKQFGSKVELEFDQQTESLDKQGNAMAKITIREIKYFLVNRTGVTFDFDSKRESDRSDPFVGLIGQSYKIQISPTGTIKVIDTKSALHAVKGQRATKLAEALLRDKNLVRIHQVLALPDTAGIAAEPGYTWTKKQDTHKQLQWAPKTFQKTYTVSDVKQQNNRQIAFIQMNAIEEVEPGTAGTSALPGELKNLFAPEESFTGQMILELDTGVVQQYNEKFAGTYTAIDQKAQKDPDILTMGFTDAVSIELVN